jgi:hypothetical protein
MTSASVQLQFDCEISVEHLATELVVLDPETDSYLELDFNLSLFAGTGNEKVNNLTIYRYRRKLS